MLRLIREEEAARPSTRISSIASAADIAAQRNTPTRTLIHILRGELDWIVLRALEKIATALPDSANGFAMDIQRYLNDEPVQACPPSTAYRFRKFAGKHKVLIGAQACC